MPKTVSQSGQFHSQIDGGRKPTDTGHSPPSDTLVETASGPWFRGNAGIGALCRPAIDTPSVQLSRVSSRRASVPALNASDIP